MTGNDTGGTAAPGTTARMARWRPVALCCLALLASHAALTAAGRGLTAGQQRTALTTVALSVLLALGGWTARRHRRLDVTIAAAEQEAQVSHSQLQRLIDNTAAVIYMKRIVDGRYLLVNREWERLFKVGRDRVIDLTDHGVFPTEMADGLRANDLWVAEQGKTVQFEERADTDEGQRTYVSVKFPVVDRDGEPYAVCGISTDITEWKQAEEQVRRLNNELEERVRRRTAELEASTRELDAFAYSVSHDLRAPLRSLHGFSQALLDDYADSLDETGRDYLRRVQTNAARMGGMIDDLLNLSRATRIELIRQDVDLGALAREIVGELRAEQPDRTVEVTIDDDLHETGDPRLLRLLLYNLLANAWKFTRRRPAATIHVGRLDRAGERFVFVRDNGAGFDMRYADKLFTAFQRLHAAQEFEGTGIGLAIVARVVHRHGGRVTAEAAPDQGATFSFTLRPADPAPADRQYPDPRRRFPLNSATGKENHELRHHPAGRGQPGRRVTDPAGVRQEQHQ